MNIFLWIFQVLLALHTAVGAVWKLSNTEQSVESLKVIPHGVWMAMMVVELLCSACLILPAFNKSWGISVPIAASFIAFEMLAFCVLHLFSGAGNYSEIIYWLVVAVICIFIAYGRFVLKPFV